MSFRTSVRRRAAARCTDTAAGTDRQKQLRLAGRVGGAHPIFYWVDLYNLVFCCYFDFELTVGSKQHV